MKGKVSPIIRIVSMILSFTNRGLVKLLRVWWFWICWFSSCFFFSLIISLNTSCRVEIGWYSRYRAIRWTVFVWKWNLRTKSCHFPWCWRTRRNTRLILRERLLQSYYAIHQFNLWNHQNVWITNCNSIFHFLWFKTTKNVLFRVFFSCRVSNVYANWLNFTRKTNYHPVTWIWESHFPSLLFLQPRRKQTAVMRSSVSTRESGCELSTTLMSEWRHKNSDQKCHHRSFTWDINGKINIYRIVI